MRSSKANFWNRRRQMPCKLCFIGVTLLALCSAGCLDQMVMLGYILTGEPSIEPNFDRETKKSMTDKSVKVAVICFAPNHVQTYFANIDKEIGKYVAYRLKEHHVKVFNPDKVQAWLDKNDDWDRPAEIGDALQATYVIYIDLHTFSLWEESSSVLLRGQASGIIRVVEMDDDGEGVEIYETDFTAKFPLAQPKQLSDTSYNAFKRRFLLHLSEKIGRHFYEHYHGDSIMDAT